MKRINIINNGNNFSTKEFADCFGNKNFMYIKNNEVIFDSKADLDFVIYEYTEIPKVLIEGDYIILSNITNEEILFSENQIVLFDSNEFKNFKLVQQNCTVSCGTGEKNSISLSGLNENSIALNIARKIFDIEIQEFIIKLYKPISNIYTAIFAFTLLLLSNREDLLCVQC